MSPLANSKNLIEISEHYLVDDYITKDSIIVDCGACVGEFTAPMYEKHRCKFLLYEPDIRNFRKLKYRFRRIKDIEIFHKAIDVDVGKKIFYLGNFITASSLHKSHRGLGNLTIEVETTTIDRIIEDNDIDKVDILKLDIEGTEINVIPNISEHIYKRIRQLLVEYHLQAEIDTYSEDLVNKCRSHIVSMGFDEIIYDDTRYNKGQEACYIMSQNSRGR